MFTVYCDYLATGEGSTVMVLFTKGYGSKTPRENALDEFARIFGGYYAIGAEIYEGIKTDFPFSNMLLSESLLKFLNEKSDAGNIHYHASFHVNYS